MFDLGYERMAHVLTIATLDPEDVNAQDFKLNPKQTTDRDITIRFSNYVKSQIHCYIGEIIGKKSFLTYVNAYHYLNGEKQYYNDAIELLHCYYIDMATFLLHSSINIQLTLVVDIDLDDVWEANIMETKKSIAELFAYSKSPDSNFKKYLDNSKYAWLLDFVSSAEEGEQKLDNYTVAASIFDMLQDNKVYKYVEV